MNAHSNIYNVLFHYDFFNRYFVIVVGVFSKIDKIYHLVQSSFTDVTITFRINQKAIKIALSPLISSATAYP